MSRDAEQENVAVERVAHDTLDGPPQPPWPLGAPVASNDLDDSAAGQIRAQAIFAAGKRHASAERKRLFDRVERVPLPKLDGGDPLDEVTLLMVAARFVADLRIASDGLDWHG